MSEKTKKDDETLFREGIDKAIDLLYDCASKDGFLASSTDKANYRRVWGRDGIILGMAALMTDKGDLIKTTRKTLETLAAYQGPNGKIPSNVDTSSNRISYGGMADLARRRKTEAARSHLMEVHRANRLEMNGAPWSFPKYVHGRQRTACGTRRQGWSAAGAVIGHFSLEGKPFFRIGDGDD